MSQLNWDYLQENKQNIIKGKMVVADFDLELIHNWQDFIWSDFPDYDEADHYTFIEIKQIEILAYLIKNLDFSTTIADQIKSAFHAVLTKKNNPIHKETTENEYYCGK